MKITTRQQLGWPATSAASAPCKSGLVIHYDGAASPKGVAKWEHEQCLAYWHWCRRFHVGTNKWKDIGYSYGVCPHGTVLEGRGWGREQAAQPGGNRDWTSVTLMLGEGEDPTPAQIEGVRELRAHLRGKGLGPAVKGHRDFVSTSCPGNRLYGLLRVFAENPIPEKKENDVATPKEIWAHEIKATWVAEGDDDMWQAGTHLRVMHAHVRGLEGKVDALRAQNVTLLARLDELNERLLAVTKAYDAGMKAGADGASR